MTDCSCLEIQDVGAFAAFHPDFRNDLFLHLSLGVLLEVVLVVHDGRLHPPRRIYGEDIAADLFAEGELRKAVIACGHFSRAVDWGDFVLEVLLIGRVWPLEPGGGCRRGESLALELPRLFVDSCSSVDLDILQMLQVSLWNRDFLQMDFF